MEKEKAVPTVNAHVVELAQKQFISSYEARDAIRKAIDAIPEEQLRNVRGIQVTIMC